MSSMRLLIPLLAAAACGSSHADAGPDAGSLAADAEPAPLPRFRSCTGRAFTPAPDQGWRHTIATPITTAAGAANHSGADAIETTGTAAVLRGKFAYGFVSKDLEDELVRVWIDDCGQWRGLGDVLTDDDGRIAVPVPAGVLTSPGVYEARFQVLGDRSLTAAWIWILPAATRVVLTDIDATLSTGDPELFHQVLDGSYVPTAYQDASALTNAHAVDGQIVIYLTGRPYWLSNITRDWLADLGFTRGPLIVAQSNRDAVPTESGVGDFKRDQVAALRAKGLVVDVAYGNASTDIYAYLAAGLAADRLWIIGPHGGEQGTHAVPSGSWTARTATVEAAPPVAQPFDW
jgi:hypothetical protein